MKPVVFFVVALISAPAVVRSQASSPDQPRKSEASNQQAQAFVVESLRTAVRFENDGTGTREMTSTIHVLSEAAVKQFGLLTFGYSTASEDLSFPYVRVKKPDGTVIPTPPGNVQDTTAEITREAPCSAIITRSTSLSADWR